jgi:hypothetical protein
MSYVTGVRPRRAGKGVSRGVTVSVAGGTMDVAGVWLPWLPPER